MADKYKIAIVAAGRGLRLKPLTDTVNKALVPVAGKAVISHIIEKFPVDVEVVVAVGYEKEKLQEYLGLAYPERAITYVDVDNVDGPGSGPATSLLACRSHLQCPFIFSTVDTVVTESVPEPTQNWLGVSRVSDTSSFNSVLIKDGFAVNMQDKVACDNTHAFIGLCGIQDYEKFWQALDTNTELVSGERQLSNGLRVLIVDGMPAVEFTWYDTGTMAGYQRIQAALSGSDDFDFSKTGEYIYFVGGRVIKFFADKEIVARRVQRAKELTGFVPQINCQTEHFYTYQSVSGQTFYSRANASLAHMFFRWLADSFWTDRELVADDQEVFRAACRAFYYDKTMSRVDAYYRLTHTSDTAAIVHGVPVPQLADLLNRIDWDALNDGLPSRFHGDLQYDNVLVTEGESQQFVLLDWRQDFAGLIEYGDRYYDLAKLYGGHIIPYHLIKKNMFSYEEAGDAVTFDIASTYNLQECRAAYDAFLASEGYDMKKVRTLTALIFLNMSPLHAAPFDKLLHHLGRLELMRALEIEPVKSYASAKHI